MIPSVIRISGKDYTVVSEPKEFIDCGVICDGSIRYNDVEIHVNVSCNEQRIRQILFHEVFHGIANAYNIQASEEDIDRYANGLYQVWKDNPSLFDR